MGSVVSAIGSGIIAIIDAVAYVIMSIIDAITTVIVTIVDFIVDILCCRCCSSRRRVGSRTGYSFRRRRAVL